MDSDTRDTSNRVRPVEPGNGFRCDDCNSKFKRKDILLRHRRTLHDDFRNGQQKHRCPFEDCDVEVGRRDHLRRHVVLVHKADPDEVLPPPQPKLGRRLSAPRQGRKSDTKEEEEKMKRFKCVFEGCDWRFSRMYDLKRHVRLVHKQDPDQVPGLESRQRESGVRRSSGGGGLSKRGKKGSKWMKKEETKLSESGWDILQEVMNEDVYDDQPEANVDQFVGQDATGNLEEMEETIIMEESQDPVLCILCTYFYIPSAQMGGSEVLNELVYQVAGHGGDIGGSSSSNFETAEVERLSVCSQCREVAGSVVEKRLEVDLIEVEVRRLQLQILKETRRLEKRVADYRMEWRKLEDVVNESDVACLEEWLGRNVGEGKTEDNSLVLRLRDAIVAGGNPLDTYHKDLERKLCYSQDDLIENHVADEYPEDRSGSERMSIRRTGASQQNAKVTPPPQPVEITSTYSKAPEVEQDEECDDDDDSDSNPSPVEALNEVGNDDDVGPTNDDPPPPQQNDEVKEGEDADAVSDFNVGTNEMPECEQEDPESGYANENEVVKAEAEEMNSGQKSKSAEAARKTEKSKSASEEKIGKKKQDALLKCAIDAYKLTAFHRTLLRKCDIGSQKRQKKKTESGRSHQKYSYFLPGKQRITYSHDRPFICSKGCGASYKTGKHWLRHEKLCGVEEDGTGRSVTRGLKVDKFQLLDDEEEGGGDDMHMI